MKTKEDLLKEIVENNGLVICDNFFAQTLTALVYDLIDSYNLNEISQMKEKALECFYPLIDLPMTEIVAKEGLVNAYKNGRCDFIEETEGKYSLPLNTLFTFLESISPEGYQFGLWWPDDNANPEDIVGFFPTDEVFRLYDNNTN
ncbi:hypothetical protein [Paenibacillus apiarius]|uniref:hypothetical protein n=1 Tax=Paenibacillus apiarius TaxID=46240 RepID=UPI003B3A4AD5